MSEAILDNPTESAVDHRDNNGWSALHHACACGHLQVATLLAERGCELDAATRGGRTLAELDPTIAAALEQVRAAREAREAAAAAAAAAEAAAAAAEE